MPISERGDATYYKLRTKAYLGAFILVEEKNK